MPPAIAGGLHPGFGGGDVPGLTNLHRSHPSTRVPFLALHTLCDRVGWCRMPNAEDWPTQEYCW